MIRRLVPLAFAVVLASCGSADAGTPATSTGTTGAAEATHATTSGSGTGAAKTVDAPALPPSVGQAVLFHLQLATDLDSSGNPIGQATQFASGTTTIFGLLGWQYVTPGT